MILSLCQPLIDHGLETGCVFPTEIHEQLVKRDFNEMFEALGVKRDNAREVCWASVFLSGSTGDEGLSYFNSPAWIDCVYRLNYPERQYLRCDNFAQ